MQTELISIVIPVYNVKRYLNECINSVLKQSYNNLEIILVDDGSTDGSSEICNRYQNKDNRIVVIHQSNQGLSAARNKGISIAKGKYVTFIDSDDYVAKELIEYLYSAVNKVKSRISVCDYVQVEESVASDSIIEKYRNNEELKIEHIEGNIAIKEVYHRNIHCLDFIAVAKLYDISLFTDLKIQFPVGKLHEDAFTTYKLFYETQTIAYIQYPLYFYRMRQGSITKSDFSERRLDKLEATREECNFFLDRKEYELLQVAFFDHLHETKMILCKMEEDDKKNKKLITSVCTSLSDDLNKYNKLINIPLLKRTYYKILSIFPKMAKLKQ